MNSFPQLIQASGYTRLRTVLYGNPALYHAYVLPPPVVQPNQKKTEKRKKWKEETQHIESHYLPAPTISTSFAKATSGRRAASSLLALRTSNRRTNISPITARLSHRSQHAQGPTYTGTLELSWTMLKAS
eukprot:IDg14425t1